MISFKRFLLEADIAAKARGGLPQIFSKYPNQPTLVSAPGKAMENMSKLLRSGRIQANITEKTDGSAGIIGFDNNGFYVQMGKGERIYNENAPHEHAERRRQKAAEQGKPFQPLMINGTSMAEHQANLFNIYRSNDGLVSYLQSKAKQSPNGEAQIRGEHFYKPMGTLLHNGNKVRFVATDYDTNKMGSHGMFVIHSQLPGNEVHDLEHLKKLSTPQMKIDDDIIPSHSRIDVDVKDLSDRLKKIQSGEPIKRNNDPRMDQLRDIAEETHKRVQQRLEGLKGKFGDETEGFVVHGPVRIKMWPGQYTARKLDRWQKGSR